MKNVFLFFILLFIVASASEARTPNGYGTGSNPRSHSVKPYVRKNGTYVAPHRTTNPNKNKLDNYSTRGNFNPYTGKEGTQNPDNGK